MTDQIGNTDYTIGDVEYAIDRTDAKNGAELRELFVGNITQSRLALLKDILKEV